MRSGDRRSPKQVHMTWTEDATMNEDKQCLQRDVTEVDVSRRCVGRICLMFVMIPRRVTSALQWSRPETNVSTQPTCRQTVSFATAVCCTEVLFQPSFSLVCLTRCLRNMRHPTRWLGCGPGNGARCVPRNVTWYRLSAHSRKTYSTPHSCLPSASRCVKNKRVFARHPCIEPVTSCCLCSVARTIRCSFRAHTSRNFSPFLHVFKFVTFSQFFYKIFIFHFKETFLIFTFLHFLHFFTIYLLYEKISSAGCGELVACSCVVPQLLFPF